MNHNMYSIGIVKQLTFFYLRGRGQGNRL